jgi:hypothetical protein
MDKIGAQLEHSPCKSLKCLAQEAGISKVTVRTVTKLLELWPYKTTVMHSLQPCYSVA